MNLDDTAIAQIVRLIQMALLTGTDIVDHLRMMQMAINEDNKVVMDKEYKKIFDEQIDKMLTAAQEQEIEPES